VLGPLDERAGRLRLQSLRQLRRPVGAAAHGVRRRGNPRGARAGGPAAGRRRPPGRTRGLAFPRPTGRSAARRSTGSRSRPAAPTGRRWQGRPTGRRRRRSGSPR
jgi:hypothetical protein